MRYQCADTKGGSCFFTVTLAECYRRLLVENVDALRRAVRLVKLRYPFYTEASDWNVMANDIESGYGERPEFSWGLRAHLNLRAVVNIKSEKRNGSRSGVE